MRTFASGTNAVRGGLCALLLLAAGCGEETPSESVEVITPPATVTFLFKMRGDASGEQDFIARTSDPEVIAMARAQLQLPETQRLRHISGGIVAANPPENVGWHWRFVNDGWHLAEVSIALCDGGPQMVEQGLSYWLQLGRFCPWGSYVASELMGFPDVVGIIVRFSVDLEGNALTQHLEAVGDVGAAEGVGLAYEREGALDTHVWRFDQTISRTRAERLAQAISAQAPDIEYVDLNTVMWPTGG